MARIAITCCPFVNLMPDVVEDHNADLRGISTSSAAVQAQTIGAIGAPGEPSYGLSDPATANMSGALLVSSDRRTIASGATVGPASGLTDCVKVNSSALAPETHEYLAESSLVELDFAREREMYEDKGDAIVFSTNKSIRVPFHQDYDPNAMLCYVNAAANISDQYTYKIRIGCTRAYP